MLKILTSTYKFHFYKIENKEIAQSLNPYGAHLLALWHEHLAGIMPGHAHTLPYMALASRSKDGEFAAYIAQKMGFTPVRGSSRKKGKDKGGKEALRIYIDGLLRGMSGGVTVDGPKGPRRECKPGILIMARDGKCAIVPTGAHFHSFWEFPKSWDKFKIPKPFSQVDICYGNPITLAPDANEEQINKASKQLQFEINNAEEFLIQNSLKL